MSNLAIQSSSSLLPLPALPINVRPAAMADLPFVDALQKMHTKNVGWMPTATLEGKIKAGHVLIAEESGQLSVVSGRQERSRLTTDHRSLTTALGYCIATDQYFKHDDVGIIYQLNVLPGRQRGLIGASLLKAQFERSAYGCKLYCCWCAQDIAANYFWEAMGFVPLAFRTGGTKGRAARGKGREKDGSSLLTSGPSPHAPSSRIHIFWQRRIRAGDETTPWWFPSQTSSGAIREDRIVLPIPPGVRWSDEMPRVVPGERDEGRGMRAEDEDARSGRKRLPGARGCAMKTAAPSGRVTLAMSVPKFRRAGAADHFEPQKPARAPRVRRKNDPKLIAAARELRDRWLEEVNSGRYLPESAGKYEVSRTISSVRAELPAAQVTAKLIAA